MTTVAIRRKKLQSNHLPTNQHPTSNRTDALNSNKISLSILTAIFQVNLG